MSIAYVAQDKNEKNIHFSPYGHREVDTISAAVEYTMENTFNAFINDDGALAVRVEPLSEAIDNLKEIIKSHHVDRLQAGDCSIEGGVSLFDLINSFERIASHAANVALHVVKKVGGDKNFDEMHGHANDIFSEEYKALYRYYESMYIDPILKPLTDEELAELIRDRDRRDAASREQGDKAVEITDVKKVEKKEDKKEEKKEKKTKADIKDKQDKKGKQSKSDAKKSATDDKSKSDAKKPATDDKSKSDAKKPNIEDKTKTELMREESKTENKKDGVKKTTDKNSHNEEIKKSAGKKIKRHKK